MASVKDGEHCSYLPASEGSPLIAIGWLEEDAPFSRGRVSVDFFRCLCEHLDRNWKPPFIFAGPHFCSLCQFSQGGSSTFEGRSFSSASTYQLFIPDGERIFVTPITIAHYIDAHSYRPPNEFIDAVMSCPPQRSAAYLKLLLASGGKGWITRLKGLNG